MKTHLPVALRKALIAAIFAVSAFAYNKAEAAVSETPRNNVTVTETQDVEVAAVESGKEVTNFSVVTDGNITVADSQGMLLNSSFKAGGDITIGDTAGTANVLTMCGSGSTTMDAKGSITVNQSIDIHVGKTDNIGGAITITASEMKFNGAETKIQGGNEICTVQTTSGGIDFNSSVGVTVSHNAIVKTMGGQNAHVTIESLPVGTGVAVNDISGTIESTGKVSVTGSVNQVIGQEINRASIEAKHGIDIIGKGGVYESSDQELVFGNFIGFADLYTESDGISVSDEYMNIVSESTVKAGDGNISVTGGDFAYINASDIQAESGEVVIQSSEVGIYKLSESPHSTSIAAKGNITINGTEGNVEITDDTSLISNQGDVEVLATGGSASMDGGNVTATLGKVTVSGSTSTNLNGVDVDGKTVEMGSSDSETTITGGTIDGADGVKVNGSTVQVNNNASIDAEGGDVAINGTDTGITGGNVTSTTGDVDIIGSTTNTLSGVSVGGKDVSVTGGAVSVTNGTVAGTAAVTIAGTTSTVVNGVDVDGASITVGSETVTTTITNTDDKDTTLDATGKIAVTGTTVSLTDISVDSTGTDANGVSVAITGSDVEVSGENVTGSGAVNISGSTTATLDGVEVSGKTASITGGAVSVTGESVTGTDSVSVVGASSTAVNGVDVNGQTVEIGAANSGTTIAGGTIDGANGVNVNGSTVIVNNDASIDAEGGNVAIAGTSTGITGGNVTSKTGDVEIIGSTTNSLSGVSVGGKAVSVTGGAVSVTGGSVAGTEAVAIAGTTSTEVNGVDVDGKTVAVGDAGSATTVTGGTIDGNGDVSVYGTELTVKDAASIDSLDGKVTVSGDTTGITGGNVTSKTGDVTISGTSNATLENVEVSGKTASITGGKVSVSGEDVTGTDSVTIAGTSTTSINDVEVEGAGTATIGSDVATGETKLTNSSVDVDGDVTITGGIVNITDNKGIDAGKGGVTITAAAGSASIAGGEIKGDGAVEIAATGSASLDNVDVTGGDDVTVSGQDAVIADSSVISEKNVLVETTNSASIQDASLVLAKNGSVTINGADTATNTITGVRTLVGAGTDVEMTGAANAIVSDAIVEAGGNVNLKAADSDDASTATNTIADATVNAVGNVSLQGEANSITDAAEVTSNVGYVSITGSATNTVSSGAQVEAKAGAVTLNGDSNVVQNGAEVKAATGITLTSEDDGISSGNEVDASILTSTDGNIELDADNANYVANGAEINAKSGGVKIALTSDTGYANIVTGAIRDGAVVTDTNPVSITAGDGAILIEGGAVGENLVEYASLEALGQDGSITIQGEANGIGARTTLKAAKDVNITSDGVDADDGNFIEASTITSVGGAVTIHAANYTQMDKSSLSASAGVKITSTGTAADDGNEIDYSKIETETGDVTMTANGVNFVEGSQLTAKTGEVALLGGSNVLEKDTKLQASKGVSVISTGTGIQDGNLIAASTLQTSNNDVKIAAEGINLLNATKATTDNGSVLLTGSSNVVQNSSAVQATSGITVTAEGDGAGRGNQIAASTLTSTDGDIAIDANYANHVTNGAVINAESGGVKIALTSDSGFANIVSGATDTAPNPVRITAGDGALMIDGDDSGENLVEYATLTAAGTEGRITIQGKANGVGAGATLLADKGVNIVSTGTDTDASDSSFDGNLVHASSITTKEGNVAVGAKSINRVIDADLVASAGAVEVSGHTNLVQAESTIQASADISVTSTGAAAGSGNYLEHSSLKTSAGSVEISAEQSNVVSNGSTVHANQDIDIISFGTGDNRGNVIKASTLESGAGDVRLTAANINQVEASKITASGGAVELNGDSNLIYNGVTVQASAGVSMTSSGIDTKDGNQVSNSTVKTSDGDVVMTSNQFNAVINADISTGYMEGKGDIIIGDDGGSTETVTNGIVATEGHKTSIFAGQNVRVAGNNVIMGSNFGAVTIAAAQGDITLRDDNDITCAVIDAAGSDGDVAITTGKGDKGTTITNSGLYGQTVTIAGDTTNRSDDNLAVVTGENTRIASRADAGVGLTLNNVFVRDTEKGNTNIFVKTQSDIAILNRVDLQNGTLTIKQGAASDGRIVVGAGNVLNARAASSLEGRLTGAGDINKSGGDSLLLDYDHSEFTGSIYANGAVGGGDGSLVDEPAANAGSWIEISGAGVGAEASIVLKNTDLVISTDKTRIGTLDTTQDSDVNEKSTGDTLLTDGSYTADGNERTDFTTVGSVLEVNKGKAGDVVQASDMKLSDATLIKLDAEVNGAEVKADTINASGSINAAAVTGLNSTSTAAAPSTARVYIKHADLAAASNAAEGARATIMTGTMAADINEDVLYDVALSDNGTYQRTLQNRNVHLENKGDHVDLVYSKNYRSAAKDAHLNQVADALKELSDSFHHTEGTLASSSDTMKRLVDAFDYTRSEEAALRGLRSVAGTGNVLPRLMQFDSSRRHLSALRQQMEMPVCKYAWKGALNRTNYVWMSYTGSYDNLSGDSNMGDYSRNAHGAIVGVDRSLSCKLRVGLSLGYETSTGKADDSKVDADTFFVDAYATGVTGQLKHRASVGLAASSFEYDRNVLVEAGYHTFNGLVKGETDGLTLNFGYELSSDYHFSERSRMNRYLAVNLAWHQLDSGKEDGLGAVGLTTEFEDEWQADLALGVNYIREFAALRNQKLASFYANAAVHLELLNDRVTATNRLGDTGAGWQTSSMERSPLYFELGVGVVVPLSPTWTGTVGATFEISPDRYGFSGGVGARYSF